MDRGRVLNDTRDVAELVYDECIISLPITSIWLMHFSLFVASVLIEIYVLCQAWCAID